MFDFFNKFFKPAPPSGATAKERLRLVLLSDHLALAPDVIDALKADLMVVISRYVEIDQAHADVTFERREGDIAMLASIPITGVRNRATDEPKPPESPQAPVEPGAGEPVAEKPAEPAAATEPAEPGEAAEAPVDPEALTTGPLAQTEHGGGDPAPPAPRRRRRRRKAAVTTVASAQA